MLNIYNHDCGRFVLTKLTSEKPTEILDPAPSSMSARDRRRLKAANPKEEDEWKPILPDSEKPEFVCLKTKEEVKAELRRQKLEDKKVKAEVKRQKLEEKRVRAEEKAEEKAEVKRQQLEEKLIKAKLPKPVKGRKNPAKTIAKREAEAAREIASGTLG